MGEAEEEIIIPTETQGLTTLRRRGLVAFLVATIILSFVTVLALLT